MHLRWGWVRKCVLLVLASASVDIDAAPTAQGADLHAPILHLCCLHLLAIILRQDAKKKYLVSRFHSAAFFFFFFITSTGRVSLFFTRAAGCSPSVSCPLFYAARVCCRPVARALVPPREGVRVRRTRSKRRRGERALFQLTKVNSSRTGARLDGAVVDAAAVFVSTSNTICANVRVRACVSCHPSPPPKTAVAAAACPVAI